MENKNKKPTPILLSINVCDMVIRDELTKKVSLIGLFNTIKAGAFPTQHHLFHVYVALTNGHGQYHTSLSIVDVTDNNPIMSVEGSLDFVNPLQVLEINFGLQGLRFDKAGKYAFRVTCEGTFVGERSFTVIGPEILIPPTQGTEIK